MPNLEVLQLVGNDIETIEVATFRYNIRLRKISIEGNRMKTFSSDVINNLLGLQEICMDWKRYRREIKSNEDHNPLFSQIEESIKHHKGHQCKYLDSPWFQANFKILFYFTGIQFVAITNNILAPSSNEIKDFQTSYEDRNETSMNNQIDSASSKLFWFNRSLVFTLFLNVLLLIYY